MENIEMNIDNVALEADTIAEEAANVIEEASGLTKGEKIAVFVIGGTAVGALIFKLAKAVPTWYEKHAIKVLEKKGYAIYAPEALSEEVATNDNLDEDTEE